MTSLKFGTSGLRGLASDLMGPEARRYTSAFLRHLSTHGNLTKLYLGRDLRSSSESIAADCASAAIGLGLQVVDCGALPAPALAFHAMAAGAPSIMVTGSHIPDDRNGLKFFRADGEIAKADETGILAQLLRDDEGEGPTGLVIDESAAAITRYQMRYQGLLAPDALKGRRIGVFEHSSVGREPLAAIMAAFGAEVIPLGRVEAFVAVDTEAFSDAVFAQLPAWVTQLQLDAVISADGDADRPLLMDELGQFVRGDVLGLLAAQFFGADTVVTPVTSNTAIEATGFFTTVVRTRVGSPYVIEAMAKASADGARGVIGFEANGGTLLGSDLAIGDVHLSALPTRDAALPLIGVLGKAAGEKCTISSLVAALPLRIALSDRLPNIAPAQSRALLDHLSVPGGAAAHFAARGSVTRSSAIDGLQFFLDDDTMFHYRASGNAPELRCYVEAANAMLAADALDWGLQAARDAIEMPETTPTLRKSCDTSHLLRS